jgi:hypothetical protein
MKSSFFASIGVVLVVAFRHQVIMTSAFHVTRPITATPRRTSLSTLLCAHKKQKQKAQHDKWQLYYDQLLKYLETHDDDNEQQGFGKLGERDEALAAWLQDQREQYRYLNEGKRVKLTRKRAAALERIGAL